MGFTVAVRFADASGVSSLAYSKLGRDDRCPPRLGVYVASMLRKQPTMTIKVCDAVPPFSINGFVKLFPDRSALWFRFRVMRLDIRHHHCEQLSSISELRGAFGAALVRTGQHDIRVAQVHLDTAYRLTIAVVFGKSEHSREPVTGISHVAVHKMRK